MIITLNYNCLNATQSVKTLSNQAVTAKPKEDVSKRRPTSGSEITVQPLNCVVQSTASLMPSVPVDQNNNKAKEGEKLLTEGKLTTRSMFLGILGVKKLINEFQERSFTSRNVVFI